VFVEVKTRKQCSDCCAVKV